MVIRHEAIGNSPPEMDGNDAEGKGPHKFPCAIRRRASKTCKGVSYTDAETQADALYHYSMLILIL